MAKPSDVLTRLRGAKYLGSHPNAPGQVENLDIEFTSDGVRLRARKSLIEIPWRTVVELSADDRESVEKRVTGPRLLLLGAFALIAKKERVLSYLAVVDDKGEWLLEVPSLSAIELRAGLSQLLSYVPDGGSHPAETRPSSDSSGATIAERLASLDELKALGLISDVEYSSQRAAIISSL
ncbi:MAG: hypothetical protein RIB98_14835 [Acidimicrobiales bacterium]